MSRSPARHQKPPRSRSRSASRGAHARHQKPSPISSALAHKPTRIAAAVAGSTLVVSAAVAPAVAHWARSAPRNAALDQAGGSPGALPSPRSSGTSAGQPDTRRSSPAERPTRPSSRSRPSVQRTPAPATTVGRHRARRHRPAPPAVAAAPVYRNPLRNISGLLPERVDMGADFGGSGPIYAIGNGVITNATDTSSGWPGGGWITYRLTDGPGAGLQVYVAEDVTPNVQVGQTVTPSTAIATMFNGSAGIETGWAMPDGSSAESQLAEAGGISGGGPFPTDIGLNFDSLLQALGVPAGFGANQPGNGILPSNYPANWTAALKHG